MQRLRFLGLLCFSLFMFVPVARATQPVVFRSAFFSAPVVAPVVVPVQTIVTQPVVHQFVQPVVQEQVIHQAVVAPIVAQPILRVGFVAASRAVVIQRPFRILAPFRGRQAIIIRR